MKDIISKKLTIIIESTNYKNISNEVMNSIYALEKSLTSNNKELKLSLIALNENDKPVNKSESISPANWDYWPV